MLDDTVTLAAQGYGWLPNRRRRVDDGVVVTRLAGRSAVGLCGPDAARFFYDEEHIRRHGAVPGPVQATLFGRGAVHTLDGQAHRIRKSMFGSVMTPDRVAVLVDRTTAAWDDAAQRWAGGPDVVLFDEASRVLARAVCGWSGIEVGDADDTDIAGVAADCLAMVDGFATLGPRHWRARRARTRRETWLADLVDRVRDRAVDADVGSALHAVSHHRDADDRLLDARTAAVELLNVVRPTVAVSWFVAFAAHALHRWPAHRERLATGDWDFATAFAHEIRRFYPFAPFVGGQAVRPLRWRGHDIPAGSLVLLDLYGQNHDPALWARPYRFEPDRFLRSSVGPTIDPYTLVPQGAGDPATGHRCPGEAITVGLLSALSVRLARLDYDVPDQDLTIPLHRIPTRPRDGLRLSVRPARPVAGSAPPPAGSRATRRP
jgi:fatty-acid peroxygenase